MTANTYLNKAKYTSENTDEWYTTYELIEEELSHYTEQFRGKSVLCNCDEPVKSNFSLYFINNFSRLQLKKLICTSYDFNGKGKVLYIDKSVENASNYVKELNGSGDFRSDECINYLKECDIVCTNPPFSLFRYMFSLINKYNKQYLLIGNMNALSYKEIFKYIKENKAWVGYRFGDMSFRVPDNTEPRATRFWIDETGQKWRSLGNAMWLTNIPVSKNSEKIKLIKSYNSEEHPKYDSFDAINVKTIKDIPYDYFGIMGVPITYIKYHNPEQFEIIGEANHGSDNEFDLFKPKINGKEVFKRILIKRKV